MEKFVIQKEGTTDFIKKTGFNNTYVFTDKKNATKFKTKRAASLFAIATSDQSLTVETN
jgi:hypothetical protein